MQKKLSNSELKVMQVLWEEGDVTAKHVSEVMGVRCGWNINTTYSLLKRCVEKGAIQRWDPKYVCHALVSREEVQRQKIETLMENFFESSFEKLFSALLGCRDLSEAQIAKLERTISRMEKENGNGNGKGKRK